MCLSEYQTLKAWKTAATDPFNTLSDWVGVSPCDTNWTGVTCGPDQMSIAAIKVSGFGLVGTVPDGLGAFEDLQVRSSVAGTHYA